MVGESMTNIKPDHVVYSLMGMLRIFYGSMEIFAFILKIILIILFLLYEIQQLISNIDSWIECMTFHVQLLNYYTIFGGRGHVEWGSNIGPSPG